MFDNFFVWSLLGGSGLAPREETECGFVWVVGGGGGGGGVRVCVCVVTSNKQLTISPT